MNTEDRNSRRIIAEAKEGETSALFVLVALMAAVLLAFSLWLLPNPEAHAAKRAVYKGTVTIGYAPSTRAPQIDQYLYTQWDIAAAVRVAGPSIGKVRLVKERYPHSSNSHVSVWSAPEAYAYGQNVSRTAPYGVYRYGEAGVMWESQIVMGDKVGARATAAQRQAWLVAALKVAIPR